MKLHGGTLFYALALSVIIGLVMSSVILMEYYTRALLRKDVVAEEVERNAESGVTYACVFHSDEPINDVDLFGRGKDSVLIQRKPWGAFELCVAKAHTGDQSCERIAMLGSTPDVSNTYALWLADMDRPLKVTGTTVLRGTCFLPRAGIERAYIEGHSFAGRQLVHGDIKPSSRFVPQPVASKSTEMEGLFEYVLTDNDSLVTWEEISGTDEIVQSFSGKTLVVKENVPIRIDQPMSGQIIIISSVSIVITESSRLESVLIIAPIIRIMDKVHGAFQVFANDSIICGENVMLEYPSVLALFPKEKATVGSGIVIEKDCEMFCEIFAARSEKADAKVQSSISIDTDTKLIGSIYCGGTLDLKGSVVGSVTCEKFVLKTNSAVYENHLMDATIDLGSRDNNWLGSMLTSKDETTWNVLQWLE